MKDRYSVVSGSLVITVFLLIIHNLLFGALDRWLFQIFVLLLLIIIAIRTEVE